MFAEFTKCIPSYLAISHSFDPRMVYTVLLPQPCVAVLWLHVLPRQSSVPSRAATKEMIERLQCQRSSDMAWIDRAAATESGILDVETEVDERYG